MKTTLRTIVLAPVMLAAVAFTANTAMAESNINVPFNFTVGGQKCPAGFYTVKTDVQGDTVRLVGPSRTFVWGLRPGEGSSKDKRVILDFDQSGSEHVLHSIQYDGLMTSQLDKKVKAPDSEVKLSAGGR